MNEFVVKFPETIKIADFLKIMENKDIFAGINLETEFPNMKNCLSKWLKNILYIPYWIKKGTSKTINKSFTNLLIYSYFEFIGTELIYIYNKYEEF